MSGTFFAVVGPSGAGKDTLIGHARAALAGNGAFVFPRRIVTREADARREVHDTVTMSEFGMLERDGRFALSWRAHGLAYGLPAEIADHIGAGRSVVANVSRAALGPARSVFGDMTVLHVTAPAAVIARRLQARGGETEAEIERRLARYAHDLPAGLPVVTIVNDGSVETAGAALVGALIRGAAAARTA